ncbi:MAK10-like protein [Tanacetum coccineum]
MGSPPSRVILFGDIPTVIPSTSMVAPETFLLAQLLGLLAPPEKSFDGKRVGPLPARRLASRHASPRSSNHHLSSSSSSLDSSLVHSSSLDASDHAHSGFSTRDVPPRLSSNWLERLPAGSITTWEDLTIRFLAQFFPPRRTTKLCNDILMFQQHHGESLSEAWTRFKDLLQKVPHHGIDLWLQLEDPRDFAKPVKAIALPQDVPSTSDHRLIELKNKVQHLMEAYLAPTQPTQVNKITTSCQICSGPHDTQYCMEDPEQAFVEYASSRTNKAGGKWYTFKPEQINLGDTYNPSWRSHPNLRWRQPQNFQNNFSNSPNWFQPNGSIPNCSFNNHPQRFNNQSSLEGLVSNFMASQDAMLSTFEADFKRQQGEMTVRNYRFDDYKTHKQK